MKVTLNRFSGLLELIGALLDLGLVLSRVLHAVDVVGDSTSLEKPNQMAMNARPAIIATKPRMMPARAIPPLLASPERTRPRAMKPG